MAGLNGKSQAIIDGVAVLWQAGHGNSHARPFVVLMSFQRVTLLSKGGFFSPIRLLKMCVTFPRGISGLRGPNLGEGRQSPRQTE